MKKVVLLCLSVVFVLLVVVSCNNPFLAKMLRREVPRNVVTSVGSGYEGVLVTPPTAGIVGEAPSGTLPGTRDYWKGVFIEGRTVKLTPYAIGKKEVTYELWWEVKEWAKTNGYVFANEGMEGSITGGGNYPNFTNVGKAPTGNKKHPVTTVSWRDCVVWCNAYTEKEKGNTDECVYRLDSNHNTVLKDATNSNVYSTYADMSKKGFRLPTEAEWEYAARYKSDGTLTPVNYLSGATKPCGYSGVSMPSGESWESLRDEATRVAVYKSCWNGSSWVAQSTATTGTAEVGSKAANDLGLYDMSGNVWEWCYDRYSIDVTAGDGGQATVTDPLGASSWSDRVGRGGSWSYDAGSCVVGLRLNGAPVYWISLLGFRLAWRP